MHIPGFFKVEDQTVVEQFIRENSFATIVSQGSTYPVASHIPVELEVNEKGEQVLWGHLSRANPQWKLFEQYPEVLVIYMSPLHHYISSSWYDHANAPTWNYVSVQVTGRISLADGAKTWESLRRLTDKYEQDSENPVSLDTMPPDVQRQVKGVVVFEVQIDKIEAAFKLSQNRDDKNFQAILEQLNKKEDAIARLLATLMKQMRERIEGTNS
ncbi:FMN-binding negative transcriptional regulator [Paraflavitalea soli]|uniref:FMN-binding negative transcriptional regulator n=1 Tax=Paraflavitalea soli TaxID=2315862 RepID=A0A3B7MM21_9BACT|nr:FMN-binding negative transcriptional regulator [Paraflavitalea soli]AXY74359.1 FMN-binding negative transcriptional regulator [Paraflavitalea soli]